uniref:Small ribosomal subunit protein eS10 n=1 Tax=Capra hircus TaxID=9925 RepID=A0A8C2RAV4_CAPHI
MLMPKKNRIGIYELLFKEGVMVTKKDVHVPKHPELADKTVPDLHAMEAGQSPRARGYVKEQSAWRHFCWNLTSEGVQHLRGYLHLPPEIVPATLRRSRLEGERPARLTRGEADRDTYRRSAVPPGADKKAEAGAGSATEFQFVSAPFLLSTLWICFFRDVLTTNSKQVFILKHSLQSSVKKAITESLTNQHSMRHSGIF